MNRADRDAPITALVRGQPSSMFGLGYIQDNAGNEPRLVYGLTNREGAGPDEPGWMTQMCYGSDYAPPGELWLGSCAHGVFHFDAGGNGRPVTVGPHELARGLLRLGLIGEADVRYRHFVSSMNLELCRSCGALLLVGSAEGLPYRAEIDPLNFDGELAAILDFVPTWEIEYGQLRLRTSVEIGLRKAGEVAVLVQHKCRRAVPLIHRQHQAAGYTRTVIDRLKVERGATDIDPPF